MTEARWKNGPKRGTQEFRDARFWEKVDKGGPNGCWVWHGARAENGYGKSSRDGKLFSAHRISWEMANDRKVPEGFCICHHCDNPPCVNPEHLFIGTALDNNRDKVRKGRHVSVRGEKHPFAKLTAAGAEQVRSDIAAGKSHREIARRHGISPSLVSLIRLGKVWKTAAIEERASA